MKRARVLVVQAFRLPKGCAREFRDAAEWHRIDTGKLAELVIKRFLSNRRKCGAILGVPVELEIVALERRRILDRLEDYLSMAMPRHRHRLMCRFSADLGRDGIKVSVSTLYNWIRRYRALGVAGLIDHRRWKANARPLRMAAGGTPKRASKALQSAFK
jgi:Helix-turn-helix domain